MSPGSLYPPKSRGRGDRLTTRPVGRPRLHPGGYAASRQQQQLLKAEKHQQQQQQKSRDGCTPSVALTNQRRSRRQGLSGESFSPGYRKNNLPNKEMLKNTPMNNSKNFSNYNNFPNYNNFNAGNNSYNYGYQNYYMRQHSFSQSNTNPNNNFMLNRSFSYEVNDSMPDMHEKANLKEDMTQNDMNRSDSNFQANSIDFLGPADQSFLDELFAESSKDINSNFEDVFSMDFDDTFLDDKNLISSNDSNNDMNNNPTNFETKSKLSADSGISEFSLNDNNCKPFNFGDKNEQTTYTDANNLKTTITKNSPPNVFQSQNVYSCSQQSYKKQQSLLTLSVNSSINSSPISSLSSPFSPSGNLKNKAMLENKRTLIDSHTHLVDLLLGEDNKSTNQPFTQSTASQNNQHTNSNSSKNITNNLLLSPSLSFSPSLSTSSSSPQNSSSPIFSSSNVILKKLLSQEDDEEEEEVTSNIITKGTFFLNKNPAKKDNNLINNTSNINSITNVSNNNNTLLNTHEMPGLKTNTRSEQHLISNANSHKPHVSTISMTPSSVVINNATLSFTQNSSSIETTNAFSFHFISLTTSSSLIDSSHITSQINTFTNSVSTNKTITTSKKISAKPFIQNTEPVTNTTPSMFPSTSPDKENSVESISITSTSSFLSTNNNPTFKNANSCNNFVESLSPVALNDINSLSNKESVTENNDQHLDEQKEYDSEKKDLNFQHQNDMSNNGGDNCGKINQKVNLIAKGEASEKEIDKDYEILSKKRMEVTNNLKESKNDDFDNRTYIKFSDVENKNINIPINSIQNRNEESINKDIGNCLVSGTDKPNNENKTLENDAKNNLNDKTNNIDQEDKEDLDNAEIPRVKIKDKDNFIDKKSAENNDNKMNFDENNFAEENKIDKKNSTYEKDTLLKV